MATFPKHLILCNTITTSHRHHLRPHHAPIRSSSADKKPSPPTISRRWAIMLTILASSAPELRHPPARAQSWGTHSYIKEKYFQPALSPEEAVARIRQTTEGMHDMRHMLDTMSWRYVMFYIRLKEAYLEDDLKNVFSIVPEPRRKSYVEIANEVVANMAQLDNFVRSPKVYESYLYYEKTLKSLDELVAFLA